MLSVGKHIGDISYLSSSGGMAAGGNGLYEDMIISNEGHHYLYYENEAERRVGRVAVVNDLLQLEWRISGAFINDADVPVEKLNVKLLYFVFFADRNLNAIINPSELKVVKVNFR